MLKVVEEIFQRSNFDLKIYEKDGTQVLETPAQVFEDECINLIYYVEKNMLKIETEKLFAIPEDRLFRAYKICNEINKWKKGFLFYVTDDLFFQMGKAYTRGISGEAIKKLLIEDYLQAKHLLEAYYVILYEAVYTDKEIDVLLEIKQDELFEKLMEMLDELLKNNK